MFQPNFQIQETSHGTIAQFPQCCQFLLPLTATVHLGGQPSSLSPGTLYFFGANSLPPCEDTTDLRRISLHISKETLSAFSTEQSDFSALGKIPFHCLTLNKEQEGNIETLLRAILSQNNDGNFGSDLQQTMVLLDFLIYLTPLFQLPPTMARSKDALRITPILDYIQENLSEPLNLDGLSAVFYLNKHHLCRLFKSTTGVSVMEYVIQCRIAQSCKFLQEGYSVQRAGELAGFTDNAHFIRTFGKRVGTSPGKYSKEYQGRNIPLQNMNIKETNL